MTRRVNGAVREVVARREAEGSDCGWEAHEVSSMPGVVRRHGDRLNRRGGVIAEWRVQEDDPEREPAEEIRDPVADPIATFEGLRLEAEEGEDEVHPESHGDSAEEREDGEDGVEGEPDKGPDDGPGDGRDGGTRPFDLPPHEADLVELGRDPIGGLVLALPAGHWAVGSRGLFKNLRSPQGPAADCAAPNSHLESVRALRHRLEHVN